MKVPKQVAVVGGGLAGMLCADSLASKGFDVKVFDMGRRASGGRASVRHTQEGYFFNHGLQFMKIRNDQLLERAAEWERAGALMRWQGKHGLYKANTGVYTARDKWTKSEHKGFCSFLEPGPIWVNNCLTEHLRNKHENIHMCLGSVVSSLSWDPSSRHWRLDGRSFGENKFFGSFDAVVFSDAMTARRGSPGHCLLTGLEQSEEMRELGTIFPVLDTVKVQPIFSLMIALPVGAVETEFEAAAVTGSEAFQFISLESKKPNYSSQIECQSFVAISTFEFASKLLAKHPQQKNFKFVEQTSEYLDPIQEALIQEFRALVAPMTKSGFRPLYAKAQRWGGAFYSNAESNDDMCFVDSDKKLALCGDYCAKTSSAENAMISGLSAGERMAKLLSS